MVVSVSLCRCFVTYDLAWISLYTFLSLGPWTGVHLNSCQNCMACLYNSSCFSSCHESQKSKDMDALLKQADTLVARYSPLVDITKSSLAICLLSIAFNPTAWNIVARNGVYPLPPYKVEKDGADVENGKNTGIKR